MATTEEPEHEPDPHDESSAQTSPLLRPIDATTPLMSRSSSSLSSPSEFTLRDDPFSGMTLVDLVVVVDAHFDLLSRKLKEKLPWKEKIPEWRVKAQEQFAKRAKLKHDLGTASDRVEREVTRFRMKVSDRLKKLDSRWNEAKTVTMREKISFFTGVMNVLLTALAVGLRPQWIPLMYSVQACYFLPLRIYSYRKLSYHYFLFDLCYFINVLCLVFIWVLPGNAILFEACYTLTHGPLATAIATWRNSLVFHSFDKITSLFVHIWPPLVMMMIRHTIPNRERDFPALKELPTLHVWRSLAVSSAIYLFWQISYYYFVIVARKQKIEQGRVTSFTYLLNDKKGAIGKILHKIPPARREWSFMVAQFVYTVVTILPAILLFYDHELANGIYLVGSFGVAVLNGANFYLGKPFRPIQLDYKLKATAEVFGRRFEKELHKLQKELDELQADYQKAAETGRFPLSRANSTHQVPRLDGDDDIEGLTRTQSDPVSLPPSPEKDKLASAGSPLVKVASEPMGKSKDD